MGARAPRQRVAVRIGASLGFVLAPVIVLQGGRRLARDVFFRFRKPIGAPPPRLQAALPVSFRAGRGPELAGWWLAGRSAEAGAVILVHGIGANRATLVRRARTLHEAGFSVLLFDQRAHGESRGQHIGFGGAESADVAAAIGFVRGRMPGARVGAIAISLGGAATVLGSPAGLDAVVLESVFADIRPAIETRIRAAIAGQVGPRLAPVLSPVLGRVFEVLLPFLLGVRRRSLRPIARIDRLGAPVLVASGTADPFTVASETEALFAQAREPKTLWWADGAAHEDLERFAPEAYWDAVMPFLSAHLRDNHGNN